MEESEMGPDPIEEVRHWLAEAREAGEPLAEAMSLATASAQGRPSLRTVLLQGLDQRGILFFTDCESAKGRELRGNPLAAVVLHWRQPTPRQVRAVGTVAPASAEESDAFWSSRPPSFRRSALACHQDEVVGSREELEGRIAELLRRFPDESAIPRPARWGGLRVAPTEIELWEERPDQLHDRLRYRRHAGGWVRERLAP